MLHDPFPQANGLSDTTQPTTDTADDRLMNELQELYLVPQIPQRLVEAGAEQVRQQRATSKRRRAGRDVFGRLWPVTADRNSARASDGLGGGRRHEGPSRPATVVAIAAVALISLLATAVFARPGLFTTKPTTGSGHDKRTSLPTVQVSGPPVTLTSIAMVSANDGWAFGSITGDPGYPTPGSIFGAGGECVVLHYNGVKWARSLNSACAPITSIAMLSANDGWAVGYDTILHYTQGSWRVDTSYTQPSQNVMLERVAMVSPNEGWAVGWAETTQQASILHYTHGHWTPANIAGMAGVTASGLRGIVMVSAREGWAVGSQFINYGYGEETTLVLHYINGQWTRIHWSMAGSFNSVAAFPSGDVWAVGEVNAATGPALIVHLQNGVPIQQDHPVPGLLHGIAMVSPSEGWVVGDGAATVHYHNGVWVREGLTIHGYYMMDISLVSATEGWAVGNTASYPTGDPNSIATLFHLSGGVWRIYPLSGL